ncbi:MAG: O-antigen ligase domain-containing protein, partial [Acidobacteriia bacterium]|nr:O-antigen ligase domain-containing protein [Terriglobia bacterium]
IWLLYLATSASPGKVLFKAGLGLLMTLPILLATSLGEKIIDLLPFTGSVQAENVTFRARLVDVAIRVILQNPFFGAFDYIYSPQMQELKEGGIIDIVNTYIGIALSSGLVGLSLFAGFFAVIAAGIFSTMRKLPNRDDERYVLGQALLSTLIGIMVIIGTVSSVWIIPVVYWLVAGLGVAYARMMALAKADTTTLETAKPARF